RSRLLKLGPEHIRFVFDCLQENTTQVRNMKQYLLTVLFNAPVTIDCHYAARVNHDLYGGG
ncbi:MAG: helix-turn-helix domain-containing protein, partial [Flavonifractor sp.]|nr:helix-turn-helix domain-containing protein [Flavonifractor sp.]MCI9474626.1 helix-turn-helix domain-containing protein [Flavonifractor sp.]